jgi:hypothetical protein
MELALALKLSGTLVLMLPLALEVALPVKLDVELHWRLENLQSRTPSL